ncbi:DUF4163 domain-containing protein [Sphingobium subterraneum]|uniref:Deacetylase PdaC domain-containing protein n=1 Tax=Sphingobium subterraneum TaxID=627688 RepID=A0A841J3M9_9SPHN|nr:DUF4163 domain-containing protein [Sphingobium subterraneum]MBB6123128.1 hypothetical protein [Sphingobium subterraneum]
MKEQAGKDEGQAMQSWMKWAVLLLALPGCRKQDGAENRQAPAVVAVDAATPVNGSAPSTPAAATVSPVALASDDGTLDFTYAWPGEAAAIPKLDSWLRGNADTLKADALRAAKDDRKSAEKDGFPYRQHSYEEKWAVVADTPRLLIMQSEDYVYTGGAHGMPISTAILWDRQTEKRLAIGALMDVKKMAAITRNAFCKALDGERAKKRGGDPQSGATPDDPFNGCPDMAAQLVLPISSEAGAPLDRLRVYIGPYEAGPYAEGIYQMDLPFSRAMLVAVRPKWRDAFRV